MGLAKRSQIMLFHFLVWIVKQHNLAPTTCHRLARLHVYTKILPTSEQTTLLAPLISPLIQ
jgi:hypothetical protein